MIEHSKHILLDLVRQTFASVVWTHKIQEKQADIFMEKYNLYRTINIVVSALVSCGVFSLFWHDNLPVKIITCILAFISLFGSSYIKYFDLLANSKSHKNIANELIVLRNKLLIVIADIFIGEKDLNVIYNEFLKIQADLNKLYLKSPITTQKAVDNASKALDVNHEYTYTQDEIDNFLPPSLRSKVNEQIEERKNNESCK